MRHLGFDTFNFSIHITHTTQIIDVSFYIGEHIYFHTSQDHISLIKNKSLEVTSIMRVTYAPTILEQNLHNRNTEFISHTATPQVL